jgi:molybdopterin/thiamine biosynthesis adenylyltransferase
MDLPEERIYARHRRRVGAVLIVGSGAVGGFLAEELARLGVSPIHLIDPDTLEVENLVRHPLGASAIGQSKASALASEICRDFPLCNAIGVDADFLELPASEQFRLASLADVVVAATDSAKCQRRVNEIALAAEKPAVYPAIWVDRRIRDAEVGEILWMLPGRHTPCYACANIFRGAANDTEAARGTRVDIQFIALAAAQVVAALLDPTNERSAILDPQRTAIYIHGLSPTSPSIRALFPASGLQSRNVHVSFPSVPCPACGGRKAAAPRVSPGIALGAYQAIREALPVIFWYKRSFADYLRGALRDQPALMIGLNFGDGKRHIADALVDRLQQHENSYSDVTIRLMLEIASMERFPDLEVLEDADIRVADATRAVAEVRGWTWKYSSAIASHQRRAVEHTATAQQAEATHTFSNEIQALKEKFFELQSMSDAHARGRAFETFLDRLFALFDMEPRLGYRLQYEQIDGSISFETDDYIIEAKWWQTAVERKHVDEFTAKLRRKGKNALGIFVSVNGFSSGALAAYRESTPFLAVDGEDLALVLNRRVRLDDLLRRKKRFANETGDCFFPARKMIE